MNDQLDTVKKPVTFELKNEGKPIAAEVVQVKEIERDMGEWSDHLLF